MKQNSNPLTAPSRSSMSSWDFSMELPRSPNGHMRSPHTSAHPTYFGSNNSHHSHLGHHSHHHTLDALEENKYADVFEQLKAAQPDPAVLSAQDVEGAQTARSSPASSVFALSEDSSSDPTSPELAASSLKGSSVATTPLSCSPAAALNTLLNPEKPALTPPPGAPGSDSPSVLPPTSSFIVLNRSSSMTPEKHRALKERRCSSPTSTTERATFGSMHALKRVASASGRSGSKSVTGSASPPESTELSSGANTPKESRWRKLMRGGKAEEGSVPVGASPPGDRKKSPLGRILERSGK